nr:anti-phage dCTP deaminase [Paucibacter sp. M5-1]MCZ7881896.1 anti-phage dCTP deaminase [Paucibacter sp. M5-1]
MSDRGTSAFVGIAFDAVDVDPDARRRRICSTNIQKTGGRAQMATRRGTKNAVESLDSTSSGSPLTQARLNELMDASDPANIELVFGFVGPTGIDLNKVCDALRSQLRAVQYEVSEVRLSEKITTYLGKSGSFPNEYKRIKTLMDRGTGLREESGQPDIVARLGIAAVREARQKQTNDALKPAPRRAYFVRSFKRPEEVEIFRQVYGKAFTLISVYASRSWRLQFLRKLLAPSLGPERAKAEEFATELIGRDYEEEERKLGQRVGKTFPLADYFVTSESRPELERQLKRLVQLTFGNPYISPSRDEQAMFLAKASALRSLDLSRQVGAAVVSSEGEILSTGCNEVPRFGGGLYWSNDDGLMRDFERGSDSNVDIKREIVEDAFNRMQRKPGLLAAVARRRPSSELAHDALFAEGAYLRDAQLFDVIEFGRAVHAEMAAISQAARSGVRLQDARLFCTTFPCHICARHIVAAGISEVVFIEPYEKSRTAELYGDSISVEPAEPSPRRANFRAFVGVAPRRYMDFFESFGVRKTVDGKIKEVDELLATPRIKRLVFTYTLAEAFVVDGTKPPPSPTRARSIK